MKNIWNNFQKMCDGYENWRLRNNQHDVKHNKEKFNNLSCEKCYPIQFGHSNNKHFRRFTRWLRREIPETKSVSGKTAEKFLELLEIGGDFNRDNWNQKTKWRIEKNVNELLKTIRYSKRPTITIEKVKDIVISIRYYRKPRQTNAKICRKMGRLFSIWIYEDITFSQAINRESETLREAELSEISEISERNTKENSPEKNDSSSESEKSKGETFIEELEEELRNEMELGKGKSKEKSVEEIIDEIEDEIGREMNDAEINELQIVLMETSKQIEVIIGEFVKILQKNDEQEIQQTEERESDEMENSEEELEQEFENVENEEENIFEEQDENIINTPQILSDSSTSEDSDSSEEIEIEDN